MEGHNNRKFFHVFYFLFTPLLLLLFSFMLLVRYCISSPFPAFSFSSFAVIHFLSHLFSYLYVCFLLLHIVPVFLFCSFRSPPSPSASFFIILTLKMVCSWSEGIEQECNFSVLPVGLSIFSSSTKLD